VSQPDINVLLIEGSPELAEAICGGLAGYGQVAFGITRVKTVAEAVQAANDRDIEVAILDASGPGDAVGRLCQALQEADFPVPILAVVGDESAEFPELGIADHVTVDDLRTVELPRSVVKLWIRSKDSQHQREADEAEPAEAREIVEHQREIVDRFQRAQATFKALMPEGGEVYDRLSVEEQLQLRLALVEAYIDITKVYFARADEESEDLIRKLCEQLVRLRYPPKELTAIHMAALELMLTEPGQPHRKGLISQNRLVFIDILLNLLGFYHSLATEWASRD